MSQVSKKLDCDHSPINFECGLYPLDRLKAIC